MSKKISKKSVYIIALTLVVVLVMAISNRIVNAWGNELTFSTIQNGEVKVNEDIKTLSVTGTIKNAVKVGYSFDSVNPGDYVYATENMEGFADVDLDEKSFSAEIDINGVDVGKRKNIYFYAFSEDNVIGVENFTIERLAAIIEAEDLSFYNTTDITTLTISGQVLNTSRATSVVYRVGEDNKIADEVSTIDTTIETDIVVVDENGEFSIPVAVDENNKQSITYYLYVVDDSGEIIVGGKKVIVNYENPSFVISEYRVEYKDNNELKSRYDSIVDDTMIVDLNCKSRVNENLKMVFADYKNCDGLKMGYSFTNRINENGEFTVGDMCWNNASPYGDNTYYIDVNMEGNGRKYTTEGVKVYFYLFKGEGTESVLFDSKELTIKRKEIDKYAKVVVGTNPRKDGPWWAERWVADDIQDNQIILGENKNSVDLLFTLKSAGPYKVRDNDDNYWYLAENPYVLVIKEKGTDVGIRKNFFNSSAIDRAINGDYFDYTIPEKITINGLNDLPTEGKEYVVSLLYKTSNGTTYDIGKEYTFTIVPDKPSLEWYVKEEDKNDFNQVHKIKLPRYSNDRLLSAKVLCAKDNDIVLWTNGKCTDDEVKELAKEKTNGTTVVNDNNIKKVTFDVNDFPKDNTNIFFYLVRKKEVFDLGSYKIEYATPKNVWSSARLLEKNGSDYIYNIDNKYYCFVTENNGEVEISGSFTNGLNDDVVIWTTNQYADIDEFEEWADKEEGCSTYVDIWSQDFHSNYTIKANDIILDSTKTEETIYLYVRRKITEDEYKYFDLGEVIVRQAQKPKLVNSNVKTIGVGDKTEYHVLVETIDFNTGVKDIILSYVDRLGNNKELPYSEGEYKPNEKISPNPEFVINDLNQNDKAIKLTITNHNGQKSVYNNIAAAKPTLQVISKKALETLGKDDYYIISSRNEIFDIIVKKDDGEAKDAYTEAKTLKTLMVDVNGKIVEEASRIYNDTKKSDTVALDLSNATIAESYDNKYKVHVVVTNEAENGFGNSAEYSFEVEVDDSKPEIQKVSINGKDMPLATENPKYVYITNKNIDVDIDVKDEGVSGLKNVYYFWKNVDGTASPETVEKIEKNTNDVVNVKASVKNSIKSQLFVDAEDVVGNRLDKYLTTGGIIVDLPENHNAENHINISLAETGMKDANGNPLYNSATTATISVSDYYSGISSVEWRVTAPFDANGNKGGSLNINDGYMSDNQWKKVSTDSNLVTEVSNQITIDCNSDDIVLNVKITDNAGNTSEKSVKLSIDKVKPTISVTYNNQTGDPDFNNYYSESRVATIVVKERNFNSDSANSILSNSVGQKGTVSAWKENKDAANPDNTTYTATVTFDKDDRYLVSYQCSDRAGNTSDVITTPEFVIDTVNPEVSVTYNNTTSKNGYYNVDRSVTISVKDVNFDAGRVYINGINAQEYTISNWTRKDNVYQALLTISKDGKYSFDVSAKDKAGNTSNSIHTPEFTIDLEAPEIIIEGVKDKSSNKESVAPVISVSDTNIDKASIAIKLEGANRGKIEIEDMYSVSEDGLNFKFKDIERLKENDDLYTLSVTASDLAGNKAENKITFSVNRFGSIYILGDKLKQINDKYVKAAKGLDITEINVDELDVNNLIITLAVNGVSSTLKEGTDYSVNLKLGNTDWKEYTYSFNDNLFTKDGSYILTLVSEDAAGNVNNSSDEDKEAEVKFGVDATAPIVSALNFEDNHYYGQNETQFMVAVKDNMILDSVSILVNGNQVAYAEDDEVYTFNVEGSNRRQDIKVVAKDAAGNETILNVGGVLVNGGFFARLIHNKIAMLIILSSLVAIAIALPLILVLAARRRR